jgi:hypothetical protein
VAAVSYKIIDQLWPGLALFFFEPAFLSDSSKKRPILPGENYKGEKS